MTPKRLPWYVEGILGGLNVMVGIGIIWFVAMLANPDIDSGTVWLLAYIYGALSSALGRVIYYTTPGR